MSLLNEVRRDPAPPPSPTPKGPRGLIGWVCTSNPFYVLSALLVCLGLWVSFGGQAGAAQTWALWAGMAGYTLLLAVTACLLVRFVGVWDDVRTVLLLVVLMFLATSVTFDEVLARSPTRGVVCYLVGLAFALAVSEGMLRGIRLKLPAAFRVPYHLALALFFLYPVAITPLLDRPSSEELAWALFGFSPAAGLVGLTLLPAARLGRGYVRENGSPWPWAWYPWALFGVLAFAVGARSALLCWSMHHLPLAGGEPYIFGFYFLVPFLLAVGVLLVEIGRVERSRGALRAAMALPAVLLVLSAVGHRPDPTYQWFLGRFVARLGGTPLYLTVLASVAFTTYAALRRVPSATTALSLALGTLAFVTPATLGLNDLVAPRPLPILAVAVLQLGLGVRNRDAWRCLVGACCLMACALIAPHGIGTLPHRGPIAYHLVMVAALAVGAAFDDPFGRLLRNAGAALALLACLVVLTGRAEGLPPWAVWAYPPVTGALIACYGLVFIHEISAGVAMIVLASSLAIACGQGYRSLRQVVAGLDYLVIGMTLFALAVLTSLVKGGVLPWKVAPKGDQGPDTLS